MRNTQKLIPIVIAMLCSSLVWLSSCKEEDKDIDLANELVLQGDAAMTVNEDAGTVTVSYELTVPARQAGALNLTAVTDNLTYGVNYSTNPAEVGGALSVPFDAQAGTISFTITVIDDALNLPNGTVTFTANEVTGENATIAASATSFALTILDDEGEAINPTSTEVTAFGEVVPGTMSAAKEVMFTTLNVVSDIAATATTGFVVGATADGEFAASATLGADATSFFVKASPDAGAANGLSSGTVTLTAGDGTAEFAVEAIVSSVIGDLFWAEYFDYPVDETYPSYGENGFAGAIVPVSARYRLAGAYNGTDASVPAVTGLQRTGIFDTWYIQQRMVGIAMGDNPLSFTGYPGSGTGRTLKLAKDGSNQRQRNDCNTENKNGAIGRRFVDDGNEITSGSVYMAAMIKVIKVQSEDIPVMKNAIMMLTGDFGFVNNNAMKVNVKDDGNGGFYFGVSKSSDDGSVVYGTTSYTLGNTYAIVFKVDIKEDLAGEAPNDELSLYVFEEGETIPSFEDAALTPEAKLDPSNQDVTDVFDVTTGLEIFFTREVADEFSAGGAANVNVQEVEFSGIRIATSWNALFKDMSEALYDNVSEDALQTMRYGNANCTGFAGGNLGNTDL